MLFTFVVTNELVMAHMSRNYANRESASANASLRERIRARMQLQETYSHTTGSGLAIVYVDCVCFFPPEASVYGKRFTPHGWRAKHRGAQMELSSLRL